MSNGDIIFLVILLSVVLIALVSLIIYSTFEYIKGFGVHLKPRKLRYFYEQNNGELTLTDTEYAKKRYGVLIPNTSNIVGVKVKYVNVYGAILFDGVIEAPVNKRDQKSITLAFSQNVNDTDTINLTLTKKKIATIKSLSKKIRQSYNLYEVGNIDYKSNNITQQFQKDLSVVEVLYEKLN